MHTRARTALAVIAALILPVSAIGATVTTAGPQTYSTDTAAMNAAHGTTGLLFEGFEDLSLLPGLSITLDFRDGSPSHVMTGALPRVQAGGAVQAPWDGSHFLTNYFNNKNQGAMRQANTVTFSFGRTVQAFGVGLSGFGPATQHDVFVEDGAQTSVVNLESQPGFSTSDTGRNGYLLIQSSTLEGIRSVSFNLRNATPAGAEDYLTFDRLAVSQVPVPASLPLLLAGVAGLAALRRRRGPQGAGLPRRALPAEARSA